MRWAVQDHADLWFQVSGVRFHTSAAAGLKNGRSDRKRNYSMTNVECRMSIDECRIKEFCLFYLLKKEQSEATSTIRQSSIIIRHSMKFHTSTASGRERSSLIVEETL